MNERVGNVVMINNKASKNSLNVTTQKASRLVTHYPQEDFFISVHEWSI